MTEKQYQQLKLQVGEKYNQSLKIAESERVAGLAAVEKIWEIARAASEHLWEHGSLTAAIKKALDVVPETFTKRDILLAVEKDGPNSLNSHSLNSLAPALARLKKQGVIEITQAGSGSRPCCYKITKPAEN